MIIELVDNAPVNEIQQLVERLKWVGLHVSMVKDGVLHRLAIIGKDIDLNYLSALPLVKKVVPSSQPYTLAGSDFKKDRTLINIKGRVIGDGKVTVIAGPCSIESEEQIRASAKMVAESGATILRGGAFKPRTSPYSFQGMGEEGLILMRKAADEYGLLTISEVMDTADIELVSHYVDILQVGSRNMQNFSLLKKLSQCRKPIFLKRGMSATYKDFLMAAEYILSGGNDQVILCERGIRTFEDYTRNTMDIAAIPILKNLSHLPVFADPSHGTGLRSMVIPMAYASVAAGADGLMVEVHPNPDKAFSDADQTIGRESLLELMQKIKFMEKMS